MSTSDPHYFDADDLKALSHMAAKVKGLAEWYDQRLVVAIYDRGDQRAIAWVECHPSDSAATVRFAPEVPVTSSTATTEEDR